MIDGGSAFPSHGTMGEVLELGMTLRDYFAAAALQGYRTAYWQWYKSLGENGPVADPQKMAEWSYADADAMLEWRARVRG